MDWIAPSADADANGRYQDENPALGTIGSTPPAAFFNTLLDELCGLPPLVGLAANGASNAQLAQSLLRLVARRNGFVSLTAASALGPEHQGAVVFGAGTIQITLPPIATLQTGATITIISRGGGVQTIVAAAGDAINGVGSIVLDSSGATADLVMVDGRWYAMAGAAGTGGQRTRVMRQATQSLTMNTNTPITWQTVHVDDLQAFSLGMPSRLTVPAGMTRARVIGQLGFDCTAGVIGVHARVARDGVVGVEGEAIRGLPRAAVANTYTAGSGYGQILNVSSSVLDVTEGMYFELLARAGRGNSDTAISGFPA